MKMKLIKKTQLAQLIQTFFTALNPQFDSSSYAKRLQFTSQWVLRTGFETNRYTSKLKSEIFPSKSEFYPHAIRLHR